MKRLFSFSSDQYMSFKYKLLSLFTGGGAFGLSFAEALTSTAEVMKSVGIISAAIVSIWSAFRYFQKEYKKYRDSRNKKQ